MLDHLQDYFQEYFLIAGRFLLEFPLPPSPLPNPIQIFLMVRPLLKMFRNGELLSGT